jgi:pimeloyl-ACP methyl ester carboxylesterase
MFFAMFDGWAQSLKADRPKLDDAALRQFRDRMYGTDFVFNVSREFVRSCKTPMLILCGNDDYHPTETSKEIAALAPNAELVENWKSPEVIGATVKRVSEFLLSHTSKS